MDKKSTRVIIKTLKYSVSDKVVESLQALSPVVFVLPLNGKMLFHYLRVGVVEGHDGKFEFNNTLLPPLSDKPPCLLEACGFV